MTQKRLPEGYASSRSLKDKLTEGAPLAVLLVLSLLIVYQLRSVLELIAIAILLSLILQTLLNGIHRVIKQRWLAVLVLAFCIFSVSVLIPIVIIPDLLKELQQLSTDLPAYLNSLTQKSQHLHARFNFVPDISQEIARLNDFVYGLLTGLPRLLEQAFGITIEAFATIILALYITYDPNFLSGGLLRLIPRQHHQQVRHLFKSIRLRLQGWMSGTLLAMLFLGVGVTIGLWILGIPLPLPFGLIAGLFEVIPYIGSFAGGFLPALVAFTISPLKLVLVLVLFLLLNQIDAHIFQPIVVGQQVNLHPIAVIIAVLVMGQLLGLIGVVFAIPAAVVVMTFFDELTSKPNPESFPTQPPSV
ncbi:AI-2E family transporter [Myxosarcina sp. GI1]|uniref:AI-2E family transporter n=1 Tax=Myxosarcina sp. GI1 TaxID=1541065 RepID=UPI00068F5E11|nr:AI-2E family transporter [Myxosarcina sp. GI1]